MRLHRALTAFAALVALAACEENAVQDITGPAPTAGIRFFNFGLNAPQLNLYAGDQKITATSSTSCQAANNPPRTATDTLCLTAGIEATTGVAFGSVSTNGRYTGIEPGQHTLNAKIVAATDKGVSIASVPFTIESGRVYSYYVSGLYNTTSKRAEGFVVQDNFPAAFDYTAAYVRFVNASHNSQPLTLQLRNLATSQTLAIGGAVPYKAASDFVKVPAAGYDLTASNATQSVVRANIGFEAGVVYTITLRGDMTVTSTTATNRPFLDNTVNR